MAGHYLEEAAVFKAFCDEKRLRALELLRDGEKCACVLNEELGLPQSTLSYHMKILCESGVVTPRQEGKWTHYSICPAGVRKAQDILRGFAAARAKQGKCPARCAGI